MQHEKFERQNVANAMDNLKGFELQNVANTVENSSSQLQNLANIARKMGRIADPPKKKQNGLKQ